MAFSKTEIFNLALTHLGVSAPLQNSNEHDPRAFVLNNLYSVSRDTILEAHEWSFANAFKVLPVSLSKSPNPLFDYAFNYPADCIVPRAVINPHDGKEKKIETAIDNDDQKIILTQWNPCILRYTKRIENTSLFSSGFVSALAYLLAANAAQSIVGSMDKKNSCLQDYQIALKFAITMDARKNVILDEDDSTYIDVR